MIAVDKEIFENTAVAFAAKSDVEIQKAKWLFSIIGKSRLVSVGTSLATLGIRLHLPLAPIFRYTVYGHFCGGETFEECKSTIAKLSSNKVSAMLNYGVELKEREEDFDKTIEKNIEALNFAGANKAANVLCIKITGFGRHGLFEKIQSGGKLSREEQKEFNRVEARLDKLCAVAAHNMVSIMIDAEESWIQDPLDKMVEEMMAKYNQKSAIVFNTLQMYRWDRLDYLHQQFEQARSKGYLLALKLVRGAYMEKERERAAKMSYKSPIHIDKPSVDKDFNAAVKFCFNHIEVVSICIASQSEASNLMAVQEIDSRKIDRKNPHIIFSQLYGMGDNITFNLARLGFNAYKYLPYGPVKDVIPYLIRRAQENTSVSGQMGRELKLLLNEIVRRKGAK